MGPLAVVAAVALAVVAYAHQRVVRRTGWGLPEHAGRLLALLGVLGFSGAWVAWFTSASGFYTDDLINFRQAQVQGMSLRYLLEPTSAHLAPGHRLGDWVIQRFFPLDFPVAITLMVVGLVVSLALFHRLVAELCRPGAGPLVVTLLYGVSVTQVAVVQWWASGLDRVPATIFSFVATLAYVRFFRTGSKRLLALSLAALAVALLFYVKPVLVPVYLVLMRVLLLQPERPLRETVAAALKEWRVWALYLLLVGAYLFLYVGQYREGGQIYSPSPGNVARYLRPLWFEVTAPGFFGVYVDPDHRSALTPLGIVLPQIGVLIGLIWTVRRRASAWRPWALFAVVFLVNAALIGLTRIGYFGPRQTSYILFYNLETTFVFFLAAAVAVLPARHARHPHTRPAAHIGPARIVPTAGRVMVGLAVLAYVVFSWQGATRVRDFFPGGDARRYMGRVGTALGQLKRAEPDAALVDRKVPDNVVFRFAGLYTSYSEILPLVNEGVTNDPTGRYLWDLDGDSGDEAVVRPVTFVPTAGGDARTLLWLQSLGASHATIEPSDDAFCVRSGPKLAVIGYQPGQPLEGQSFLRLGYSSEPSSLLGVVAEPIGAAGRPRDKFVTLATGGGHITVMEIDAPTLQRLYFVVAPNSRVCLDRIELGHLASRPGPVYSMKSRDLSNREQ
ncbi:MAG: hypothetical protein ACRD0Q_07010 [Acidimicrobiales bacterium]